MVNRSSGSVAVLISFVLFLLLAPLVYFASVGPVAWLADKGMVSVEQDSIAYRIYWPLESGAAHCRPLGGALAWYVSLFRAPRPDPIIY